MNGDIVSVALQRALEWRGGGQEEPRVSVRTSLKGRIRTELEDVYTQEHLPCQIQGCSLCAAAPEALPLSVDDPVWVIDLPLLWHGPDFLWDDECINNGVLLESHLQFLQTKNLRAFTKLLRLCRIDREMRRRVTRFIRRQKNLDVNEAVGEHRRYCVYPDLVSSDTRVQKLPAESEEQYLLRTLVSVADWYQRHVELAFYGTQHPVIQILTTTPARKHQVLASMPLGNVAVYSLTELLDEAVKLFPHAGNKLPAIAFDDAWKLPYEGEDLVGDEADDDPVDDQTDAVEYPPYVGSRKITQLLHEQKAVKGVIRMSPNACFRATVSSRARIDKETGIHTPATEVRVVGALNVNRAINGDDVVVEILTAEMLPNVAALAANLNLVEGTEGFEIDSKQSTEAQFVLPESGLYGRVVAILRRGPGTYCGTLRPVNKVMTNLFHNTTRELVPVNPCVPPCLITARDLTPLENKRLVFVYDDWRKDSLLPTGHWIEDLGPVDDIQTECKVILREHNIVTKPFTRAALSCLPNWVEGETRLDDREIKRRIDLRLRYCPCDECRQKRNNIPEKALGIPQQRELLGTPCIHTIDPARPRPLVQWNEERDAEYARVAKIRTERPTWEEYELAEETDDVDMDGSNSGVWCCSIDPPTCVDIDDSLSVKFLKNGNYEVGVHIADVTHYVRSESALDREAADRCTTVYLVNQRTDMLPKLLSADLCSLRAGRDRLCFSVFWEMTPKAKVVRTKFYKSVIHSVAAFSYEQAQKIIDNVGSAERSPPSSSSSSSSKRRRSAKKADDGDYSPIAVRLRVLNDLAKSLRASRIKRGSVELAGAESKFTFSKIEKNGEVVNADDPVKVEAYEHYDTHYLIEEFMLLANISVATKIASAFPQCAVLRRHPAPKGDALEELARCLAQKGFRLKFGSSKELAKTLDRCVDADDPLFNKLVRQMTVQCMNRAAYYCTGDVTDQESRRHYALAADLYTHFTSPIRRYADVMVHRLLAAAIDWESLSISSGNMQMVVSQCDKMSEKHMNAQFCQRASADYFAYRLFSRMCSSDAAGVTLHCVVTQVRSNGLVLTCPSATIDSVCFIGEGERFEFDEAQNAWMDSATGERIGIFDHVLVKAFPTAEDFRFKVTYRLVRKASKAEVRQDLRASAALTLKHID